MVQPDAVYWLGGLAHEQKSQTIFSSSMIASSFSKEYFVLILIPENDGKSTYEWEDIIETHCKPSVSITSIVLQTHTFEHWLQAGYTFAVKVCQQGELIYNQYYPQLNNTHNSKCTDENEIKAFYKLGLSKANEFLKTAELCSLCQQNTLAVFMLHQSTEQGLTALLKAGAGYHRRTHNLGRLIRLSYLITSKTQHIFPQDSEQDKRLFKLLQNAYSDARYKRDYKVSNADFSVLLERVKSLVKLLCRDFQKDVIVCNAS
ncbi:HEPN domain-containing protein [Fulvivirga sediminis]|uniref:HEPN domain-containing protein n=1 Tax=Fulvivirga sediminis TaxID=2803949 RepID=A0A937F6B1_9BACT|nr:HEPN domain-containing protein [Fulvivirga sediminis]MBL3655110.1 HEPN domain-containing protein [Fulvivirga sediminis]